MNWDTRLESLALALDISNVMVSYYLQSIAKEDPEDHELQILHGSLLRPQLLHSKVVHACDGTSKLKCSGQWKRSIVGTNHDRAYCSYSGPVNRDLPEDSEKVVVRETVG